MQLFSSHLSGNGKVNRKEGKQPHQRQCNCVIYAGQPAQDWTAAGYFSLQCWSMTLDLLGFNFIQGK